MYQNNFKDKDMPLILLVTKITNINIISLITK